MTEIVLTIHILAACAWFGGALVSAVGPNLVAKNGGHAAIAAWYRTMISFGTRLFAPAAVVLLITGIELVRSGGWSYSDVFVILGIVAVVIGAVLGSAYYAPRGERIAAAHDAGDAASAAAEATPYRTVGLFDLAFLVFTIYAMVAKLGG